METFHIKFGFLISLKKLELLVTLDIHSHMDTEELLLLEVGHVFSIS